MSFESFVNSIINAFNTVFSHIVTYIQIFLNNNFIKFIIFLGLFGFIINFLFSIIKIIYEILNNKHDKQETKELFSGHSNETVKNGGNIKSKDIYW